MAIEMNKFDSTDENIARALQRKEVMAQYEHEFEYYSEHGRLRMNIHVY